MGLGQSPNFYISSNTTVRLVYDAIYKEICNHSSSSTNAEWSATMTWNALNTGAVLSSDLSWIPAVTACERPELRARNVGTQEL